MFFWELDDLGLIPRAMTHGARINGDGDDARQQDEQTVRARYPALVGETLVTVIPSPAETETRLYEVPSYPRYPKYFQRHLW